jgi:oxygen-dependent protoporphyrinogen oxidase
LLAQGVSVLTSASAQALHLDDAGRLSVQLATADGAVTVPANAVISTLPPKPLATLLEASCSQLRLSLPQQRRAQAAVARLHGMTSLSLVVVTMVFEETSFEALMGKPDAQPGFGFLMPECEARGLLLGVVYDSCVFPELAGPSHSVLTAMLGGADPRLQERVKQASSQELEEEALDAIHHHLGVTQHPTAIHVTKWLDAIPQFDMSYSRGRLGTEQLLRQHLPWLSLTGKAFGEGVGVNDCILGALATAEKVVQALPKAHPSPRTPLAS